MFRDVPSHSFNCRLLKLIKKKLNQTKGGVERLENFLLIKTHYLCEHYANVLINFLFNFRLYVYTFLEILVGSALQSTFVSRLLF